MVLLAQVSQLVITVLQRSQLPLTRVRVLSMQVRHVDELLQVRHGELQGRQLPELKK
jgi:hypothetical protein